MAKLFLDPREVSSSASGSSSWKRSGTEPGPTCGWRAVLPPTHFSSTISPMASRTLHCVARPENLIFGGKLISTRTRNARTSEEKKSFARYQSTKKFAKREPENPLRGRTERKVHNYHRRRGLTAGKKLAENVSARRDGRRVKNQFGLRQSRARAQEQANKRRMLDTEVIRSKAERELSRVIKVMHTRVCACAVVTHNSGISRPPRSDELESGSGGKSRKLVR